MQLRAIRHHRAAKAGIRNCRLIEARAPDQTQIENTFDRLRAVFLLGAATMIIPGQWRDNNGVAGRYDAARIVKPVSGKIPAPQRRARD